MSDDGSFLPVKVTADATKTLERAYDEALSPAAMELGERGRELGQGLKIITKPLALAGNLVDWVLSNPKKAVRFVQDSLRRVTGKLREPNPQFAGELLEGVKHAQEGSDTWEMFANLLASAADSDAPDAVQHPAFPQIVRTMAPGEAQMLRQIGAGQIVAWGGGTSKQTVRREPLGYGRLGDEPIHLEKRYATTYIQRLEAASLILLPTFTPKNAQWERAKTEEDLPERPPILRATFQKPFRVYAQKPLVYTRFGKLFARAVRIQIDDPNVSSPDD